VTPGARGDPRGGAFAVSLLWGLLFATAAYAVMRAVQSFAAPDPDPAALAWSAHSGYAWRAWTVGYAGGVAAFVVYPIARRRLAAVARALTAGLTIAAALLALQAAFFP
jgi:hypothetical protein